MKKLAAQLFSSAAVDSANGVDAKDTRSTTGRTAAKAANGLARTLFSYAETVYEAVMVGSLHTLAKLRLKVFIFRAGLIRQKNRFFSTDA